LLVTVVPFLVVSWRMPNTYPTGGVRRGPPLKFHETRDNLGEHPLRILRSWVSPPADGSRSPERSHTGDAVRNRHHAGCRVAVERAADRYTLICDEPVMRPRGCLVL